MDHVPQGIAGVVGRRLGDISSLQRPVEGVGWRAGVINLSDQIAGVGQEAGVGGVWACDRMDVEEHWPLRIRYSGWGCAEPRQRQGYHGKKQTETIFHSRGY